MNRSHSGAMARFTNAVNRKKIAENWLKLLISFHLANKEQGTAAADRKDF